MLEAVKNNGSWPMAHRHILPLWNEIIVSLSSSIIWTRRPLMPITFWPYRQNHSIYEMFKCKSGRWEKERRLKNLTLSYIVTWDYKKSLNCLNFEIRKMTLWFDRFTFSRVGIANDNFILWVVLAGNFRWFREFPGCSNELARCQKIWWQRCTCWGGGVQQRYIIHSSRWNRFWLYKNQKKNSIRILLATCFRVRDLAVGLPEHQMLYACSKCLNRLIFAMIWHATQSIPKDSCVLWYLNVHLVMRCEM